MKKSQMQEQLEVIRQRIAVLEQRIAIEPDISPEFAQQSFRTILESVDRALSFQSIQNDTGSVSPLPTHLLAPAAHQMDEALVITDAELNPPGPRFVYVNEAFTRITGYTSEEVIGKTPRLLQGPLSDKQELKRLRLGLEQERYFRGETINYRKDGSTFVIDWYIKPIYDHTGTITHWMAVQHDITQRRQNEDSLKVFERANVQLAAAVNTLTSGVVITDPLQPDNPIIFVNPGFCEMTGYTEEEVLGRNCRFLQGPETDPAIVSQLRDGIAARRTTTVVLLNYIKDGTPFWNELTVDPVFDNQGQLVNYIGLQNDISARKHAEAERDRLLEETRQAVRARDEFLTVAAHELKTPVTSLRGFAQLLLRQLSRDQQINTNRFQHGLSIVDQQSEKLARLTDQLLDVARIESGRLQLTREYTDLSALIENIAVSLQTTTSNHTITVLADETVKTMVDPLRFEQVIMNLLTNAIKYSPAGGPITVTVGSASEHDIVITVHDSGIGIAPEHREHVFDRFYQAHSLTHVSGVGVGLYISKQIVLLHSGTISVECPPEGGTQFVIHLPITAPTSEKET